MSFLNRFLPDRPQDDTLASVVRNLEYLLNSRREYGSLLCSFGLADYLAELGGKSTVLTILREMQDTIYLYEPRLRVLSIKTIGRDEYLHLHFDLHGMLLSPYWTLPCRLHLVFHPITGAVQIPVVPPLASERSGSRSLARAVRPVPLPVVSAASLAAQLGATRLLSTQPELAPLLVVAALAATAGLLPPELLASAVEAGTTALELLPELAAALALLGQAAQAGLLPTQLAATAAQAAKLAIDSNLEVAEVVARASFAAQTVRLQSGASSPGPAAHLPAASELSLLASLSAEQGLLSAAIADAVLSPTTLSLSTQPELAGALTVASLAAQLGEKNPQASYPEDDDGS